MILLVGLRYDPIIKYLFKTLMATKLKIAFIDQQCLGNNIIINDTCISSKAPNWRIEHSQVQAVINRLVGYPKQHISSHYKQLDRMIYYLDIVYPNVINKPSMGLNNNSKPLQLSMLKLKNCQIPDSYICAGSKSPEVKDLIFKSISSVRSIVQKVTEDKFVYEPVLFQKRCNGKNIRVHCLGTNYVATAISATEIDYRYDTKNTIEQVTIPNEILEECISLNEQLGLTFSGIDFIKDKDEWTLLEVNSSPGYAYYENKLLHKPISQILINHLTAIT